MLNLKDRNLLFSLVPFVLYQAAIARLVYLGRYVDSTVVLLYILLLGAISLIAPYFYLRMDKSEEVMDFLFSKLRDITDQPGIWLIYFLNIVNYTGAIAFLCGSIQNNKQILRY